MKFGYSIKKVDLNKPRFRDTEFKRNLLNTQSYKEWKKKNPNTNISQVKFDSILKEIASKYREKTVSNTDGVTLPLYLGDLKINYISYMDSPDNKKSNQVGKLVRNFNWDTGKKVGKIVWKRKNAIKFNKDLCTIAFKGCRKFTTEVKNAIIENAGHYKDVGK